MHGDCNPDLTLLFDVPESVSRKRLERAAADGRVLDKFEREQHEFTARVRAVYLARAAAEPSRFRIIDSARPVDQVRAELAALMGTL